MFVRIACTLICFLRLTKGDGFQDHRDIEVLPAGGGTAHPAVHRDLSEWTQSGVLANRCSISLGRRDWSWTGGEPGRSLPPRVWTRATGEGDATPYVSLARSRASSPVNVMPRMSAYAVAKSIRDSCSRGSAVASVIAWVGLQKGQRPANATVATRVM